MKGYRHVIVTILALIICTIFITPQPLFSGDKATKIDELMTKYHELEMFNGSILVVEKGKVIYKKGFGCANMDWDIPNAPDTKFRIASVTKQFTALVVMQLVEEGKLKPEGKITDYLPDYRKDTGERVTIHHLLTHTSGIPSYTGLPGFWSDSTRNPYTTDYMMSHFLSGDLEFEPGTQFKYNNSGYYLLAVIIERVTGKPFDANLQERIFDPLNMKNSGTDKNEEILKNRASGYTKSPDGYKNTKYFYMPNALGAGNMYSTVEDMYLWDQALHSNKLLSKKSKQKMFTPFLNNYAYGWTIIKVPAGETGDSVKVVRHTGGIDGFNTINFRLIEDKHLIVIFNNTGQTNLYDICQAITNILYDQPYELPKPSIADILLKTIFEKDSTAAVAQYHELKAGHANEYNFGESELNRLGYILLEKNKVKEAIVMFKLNVESYPESWNPYDSLGEAYKVNGNKELAIKNYAKSLELNPKNTGAIHALKSIIDEK